jgi:hypothetical protein
MHLCCLLKQCACLDTRLVDALICSISEETKFYPCQLQEKIMGCGKLTRVMCVCRGELIRDCRSLDGSSPSQCFVEGLNTVQDCADTRNYPTELVPALLAAGKGADGEDGSLCTTMLSSGTPANSKGAPLTHLALSSVHVPGIVSQRPPCA